ncbi:MAG: ABC transporter permease [Nitrososphaerales archaeon]|nr:ABC transporter permease [Nitrososphaerales archaeon]
MKATIPGQGRLLRSFAESALAGLVGFAGGGIVLAILGYNPLLAYYYMFYGAAGSLTNLTDTLGNAAPLILTGLTFAVGVRAGLFNIGAEGQVYVGAAAAVSASYFALPGGIHLAFALTLAGLGGAALAVPTYLLKAYRGVNEVITTIMMNWASYYGVLWVSIVLLADPSQPQKTINVVPNSRFPEILLGSGTPAAFIFACAVAVAIYAYLWRTPSGYELRTVGLNPEAARLGGINPRRPLLYALLLGGVASGFAGAVQVAARSTPYALYTSLGNVLNFGYNGVGVALIGRNHPIAIILAGLFFGTLQAGYSTVQLYAHVPFEIIQVIEGIIIFTVAMPELYRRLSGALKK